MKPFAARLIVCSLSGAVVLAACGSSSGPRAAARKVAAAATSPAPTTTAAPVTTAAPITTVAPTTTTGVAVTSPPTGAPITSPPTAAPTTTTAPANVLDAAINLSGTPGVTPAEQLRAEMLIQHTITDLKFFATPAEAYADGYRSIGDGLTGDEHYVNWSYVTDGHILDPARPESVVYENNGSGQRAVAAMYMLPFGSTFANVPDVGGALTQWHVHRNLCLTNNPQQKIVAGITSDGTCRAGTSRAGDTPMLHVWVTPNPCGPFAALEGIGAGQVPKGQTRRCSTKYASVP